MKWGFDEDPIVAELRLATAKHERAVMMGDPVEAALFNLLLPAIGAKRVIEVGVFTGYTTLVMAQEDTATYRFMDIFGTVDPPRLTEF